MGTSTGSRTSGTTAAEPLVLVDPGNTPSRGDRALIRLTRVGTIIFLASVLVTMTTRRQVSDDWTFAVWLRQKGLLGILPYGYTHFTGRIPLLLFGGLISTWPLALGLAVPLLSLVPATWAVRSLISRFGVGERTVTALAAFLVMGVVAGAPARNQAVFWPIGALVYVIPAAFFVGVVAIVASGSRKPTHVVAAVVCAFAAASGNEIQAVVVPFVLAAMLVNSWSMATSQGRLMRHMLTTARLAPLLAGGVGGLALVGAPGNGGRSEMMIVNVKHDAATVFSSAKTVLFVLQINLLAAGLLPAITIVVAGLLVGGQVSASRALFRRAATISVAVALLSVLTFCFVSAWGFNASAPQRSMFPVWMCCAAALFCCSAAIAAREPASARATARTSATAALPAFGVLALAAPAFAALTTLQALPRDRALARQLDCIERSVRASGPAGVTIASPQQSESLLILEDSPTSSTNTAVAERFGAGPVTRVNPGTNARCEAEARGLVPFVRPSEFGPPLADG